ncbi:uncharacterized protein UBRO_20821 [Ustilago bromivora]|uniref:Reverse transcriptase Ty1/copia-type domain-containing protein n=1 Tax=Ustilago bromivora TaxID=307758 RepID=A0A1K0G8Y4_9BASI|nr:uncharacterized protein UBRO_20821 [Ustilago bromivora]
MSHIIGMNIEYNHESCTLSIDQSGYIKGILDKFGMHEAWTVQLLATEAINTMGPRQGDTANAEEIRHYASLVRSLLWIAQVTRPDIAFVARWHTHFVANPLSEHLVAAKRISRYLKGTIDVSLVVSQVSSGQILTGWTDSDWAGLRECCCSTTGYIFAIDGFICSWSSQLQPTIANSSVDAKYVALVAVTREMLWASMFLHKLDQSLPRTSVIHVTAKTLVLHLHNRELAIDPTIPILYSNSSRAQVIANDPQHFKRTKHIDIAHFFLRGEVADVIGPDAQKIWICMRRD